MSGSFINVEENEPAMTMPESEVQNPRGATSILNKTTERYFPINLHFSMKSNMEDERRMSQTVIADEKPDYDQMRKTLNTQGVTRNKKLKGVSA